MGVIVGRVLLALASLAAVGFLDEQLEEQRRRDRERSGPTGRHATWIMHPGEQLRVPAGSRVMTSTGRTIVGPALIRVEVWAAHEEIFVELHGRVVSAEAP